MNQAKFCEQCGAALAADVRFCEACGHLVALPPPSPSPSLAPPSKPAAGASSRPLDRRLILAVAGLAAILVFAIVAAVAVQSARGRPVATTNAAAAPPTATVAPPAGKAVTPSATPSPAATPSPQPALVATAPSPQVTPPVARTSTAAPVGSGPTPNAAAMEWEKTALLVHPDYKRFTTNYADFSVNIPGSWQSLAEEAKGRQIVLGSMGSKTNLEIDISAAGENLDQVINNWVQSMKGQVVAPTAKTAVGHYEARQAVVDVNETGRRFYLAAVGAPDRTFLLILGGPADDPEPSVNFAAAIASFRVPGRCGAAPCPELLQRDALVGTPAPAPVVAAATPTRTSAPTPASSLIPSICWFSPDDLKSLSGAPADFQQLEGAAESWEAEGGQVVQYGGFAYLKRSNGSLLLWCNVYDHPIALDFQTPSGYTVVNAPRVGQLSVVMQSKNVQSIQFVKENVEIVLRLRDAAPYVTTDNVVKLASIIAERMPATIPLSGPPSPPQAANESAFSNYFKKFEIGTGDPFVAASTVAADDYVRVSVATIDPQQRYSLWLLNDKQNVVAAVRGIQGTQIISSLDTGKAGKYTVLLEAAGVIYARQVIAKK